MGFILILKSKYSRLGFADFHVVTSKGHLLLFHGLDHAAAGLLLVVFCLGLQVCMVRSFPLLLPAFLKALYRTVTFFSELIIRYLPNPSFFLFCIAKLLLSESPCARTPGPL